MYIDPSGEEWWHWALAAMVVVAFVGFTIVTAGGSLIIAGNALMAASVGVATTGSIWMTACSFAAIGSAYALFGFAVYASLSSSNINEFWDYGEEALVYTGAGAIYGFITGYLSYKIQIGKNKSWSTIRSKYWKNQGYKDGKAPNGEILHHPYGRFGSKINIFEEVTVEEHYAIHAELGYGSGHGGFNQYYPFPNPWKILWDMFR